MQRRLMKGALAVVLGAGCPASEEDDTGDSDGDTDATSATSANGTSTAGDDAGSTTSPGADTGTDTSSSGAIETTGGPTDLPDPPTTVDETLAIYGEAWNETDAARRLALLELAWADDGHYTDPMVDAPGRQAVSDSIGAFQSMVPGATITFTGAADVFSDRFRAYWMIDGSLQLPGMDAGIIGDDFRITRIQGFFGPLPSDGEPSEQLVAYVDAWNEPDAATRDALLATAVTDDFVYRDPNIEIVGRDAMSDHMAEVQGLAMGAPVSLASGPDAYAGALRYAWLFGDPAAPAFAGLDVVEVAADGRFTTVTGFFDM